MSASQPEYGVVISRQVMVPMRDGVKLAADIYRPAVEGEPLSGTFPTILGRTSYARANPVTWVDAVADFFGKEVVALELATPHFYHLDTCMRPLDGGHILYYPPAFTDQALKTLRERVAPDMLIEADKADAEALCVNAVNLGETVVMAKAPPALKAKLEAKGYRLVEVDLSPFIMSGGAAFCMTLRLDVSSQPAPALAAAE